MCAIAGIVNIPSGEETDAVLRSMLDAQAHRGPDDAGVFVNRDVALGHRRLSIIDLAGGHQPMSSDDGTVTVVFNGEIYNYRELRDRLTGKGHQFKTSGDTEVLIHLYEELGSECVSLLDGMFAFAIYDSHSRRLLLGRDRLGKKPLVYFMLDHTLVFASELAGLKRHPGMPTELDGTALSDYMSLQYIPSPDTAFRRVRKLPPAHVLEYQLETGTLSIRCYWHLDYALKHTGMSFDAAAAELRRRIEKAVEKRLVADVPLGVFLSGGVDSCIIAGIAARQLSPGFCDAFTVGFSDPRYDERAGARRSAEIINSQCGGNLRFHEKLVEPADFELLRELSRHYGEPFADASQLPTRLLCGFARESITVALSGDGADELFGGYERYSAARVASYLELLPLAVRKLLFSSAARLCPDSGERTFAGRLRRMLKLCGDKAGEGYFNLLDRCPEALKKELFGLRLAPALHHNSADVFNSLSWDLTARNRIERLEETDLHTYLPGDILTKMDIASMAVGLEVRSPFLDCDVVEFAARLPQRFKLHGFSRKYILKAAFADLLTPELIGRPKRGFGVPVAEWLRGVWKSRAEGALFNGALTLDGYIRADVLRRIWDEHQSRRRDYSYLLWELLIFALFLESSDLQ